ncbi:hypothetical protein B0J14DRAFT_597145 [Halenospora varia]|nr:hypothetical protein B0J14DRAFT_597145 [Halenospora varia]
MSSKIFGSQELLQYNENYRVLICRECQYAVQKNALASHLLRHKIYRDEKEALLASLSQFDLLEPHLVEPPSPGSPPIDGLSIIPGYRCTAADCGNLCASIKRMRRHWSEIHEISDALPDTSTFACPVTLQTFFRGTKLKYFEVVALNNHGSNGYPMSKIRNSGHIEPETVDQRLDGQDPGTSAEPSSLGTEVLFSPAERVTSAVDFNLHTLSYFHHFLTSTSLTLPVSDYRQPATQYWQANLVHQALRTKWLMCGLLAISACHMISLVEDQTEKIAHLELSRGLSSRFKAGLGMAENGLITGHSVASGADDPARHMGMQLLPLLQLAYWSIPEYNPEQGILPECIGPFGLMSFIQNIQGFLIPNYTLRPDAPRVDDDNEGEIFSQAKQILYPKSPQNPESSSATSADSYSSQKRRVLDLLGNLPFRMAEAFSKPQSGPDFLATMSAIAVLIKCCDISFQSEDASAIWWGMASWLVKIPGHFCTLLSSHSSPTLVVLAHWVGLLVRRAEIGGFWFLRGLSTRILVLIQGRIPAQETVVHDLINDLL